MRKLCVSQRYFHSENNVWVKAGYYKGDSFHHRDSENTEETRKLGEGTITMKTIFFYHRGK